MAEFSEVMRQWRRMCKHSDCGSCEITVKHTSYPCYKRMGELSEDALQQIERVVMRWAAEQQEPVYPTWMEWFANRGEYQEADDANINIAACVSILLSRIPADIAERLGIEPKEGQ